MAWIKNKIRNIILRKYLGYITPEDIITENKGILLLDGKPLSPQMASIFSVNAQELKNNRLWKAIQNTLRNQAYKGALETSKNFDDVVNNKSIAYTVSVHESIVDKVLNVKLKE